MSLFAGDLIIWLEEILDSIYKLLEVMEFSQGAKVEYRIQSSSVDQWQLTGNKVEEAQAVRMRALTISHVAGTAVMSPKEYLCSVIKHRRTHPAKQVTLFWILHRKNLWLREV